MISTAYKVVCVWDSVNNVFASYNPQSRLCDMTRLLYKAGETTRPKIGKIFVFLNLEQAINFRGQIKEEITTNPIWRVYALNATRQYYRMADYKLYNTNLLENFWKEHEHGCSALVSYAVPCPHGTYFCDEVKLIEQVV